MNKTCSLCITLLFLLFGLKIGAQEIRGRITQHDGTPVAYVSVVARTVDRKSFVTYTQADNDGRYRLQFKAPGTYNIEYSLLSYHKQTGEVTLAENQIIEKNITLAESTIELSQVEIKPNTPIIVKKDTVIFNVASFLKGNERIAEDVLKRLPGIDVDQDGTVRANGKEVDKIMIEGDDLFQKGYSLLTSTMPSKPIEQVELIQRYNENRLLKDVVKSDKVALNIKLAEDAKTRPFGTITAEGGIENKYNLQANVIDLRKKYKSYLSGGINNLGYLGVNAASARMIDSEKDELENLDLTTSNSNSDYSARIPIHKDRYSSEKNKMVLYSAIWKPIEQLKIHFKGHYNHRDNSLDESQTLVYDSEELSFVNNQSTSWDAVNRNGLYKLKATYDVSETLQMGSLSQFDFVRANTSKHILFNDDPVKTLSHFKDTKFLQKLYLIYKLSQQSILRMNATYVNSSFSNRFNVDSVCFETPMPMDEIHQYTHTRAEYAEANIIYYKTWNKNVLSIKGQSVYKNDLLRNRIELNNGEFGVQLVNNSINVAYRKQLNSVSIGGLLKGNHYWYKLFSEHGKTQFTIEPTLTFEWMIDKRNKLIANFSQSNKSISFMEINPLYMISGFNSIRKGSGEMKFFPSQMAMLNYQWESWSKSSFLNLNFIYIHKNKFYGSNILLNPQYSITEIGEFKNNDLLNVSLSFDQFIPFASSNIKIRGGYSSMKYAYRINSDAKYYTNSTYNYEVALRTILSGMFNCNLGVKGNYNYNKTNQKGYTSLHAYLDVYLIFNSKLNMEINVEDYIRNNPYEKDKNAFFVDAKVNYSLIKNKLLLSLSARNLINTSSFESFTITETYQVNYTARLLPRTILLGAQYTF